MSFTEPFFVFRDRTPVTATFTRKVLKDTIKNLGLDQDVYDTHSMRIGRASDLLKMNLSVETIKKIDRWRSNSVFEYLRD